MAVRRQRVQMPPTAAEVLRDVLTRHAITQDDLARAMGVSRYSINQLVNHRRAVTAEMALRLARALSTTPEFWLNLQRHADLHAARQRLGRKVAAIHAVRGPIPEAQLFNDRKEAARKVGS
ncbi:MAG: HigA family addiction module antitoxin [Gemmatimonadota bacterium]|nr:HigA family addiction module antitoxin [Gemmatimonadota bacterium]